MYIGANTGSNVHCTEYRFKCTLYRIQVQMYVVPNTGPNVRCTEYRFKYTLYRIQVQMYIVLNTGLNMLQLQVLRACEDDERKKVCESVLELSLTYKQKTQALLVKSAILKAGLIIKVS